MKTINDFKKDPYAKKIDINEFVEAGYLQELNRRFLNPLGLALCVEIDHEHHTARLDGIWDGRSDPEGLIYDYSKAGDDRLELALSKQNRISKELKHKLSARKAKYGFEIEPINSKAGTDSNKLDGIIDHLKFIDKTFFGSEAK